MDIQKNLQTFLKQFVPSAAGNAPAPSAGAEPLTVQDLVAPPAIEVDFDTIKIGDR